MKLQEERYEFGYQDITIEGVKGLVFDVCPKGQKDMGIKEPCLQIMTGDGGEGIEHKILGTIKFKDTGNLKLIQTALNLIDKALIDEDEDILNKAHKDRIITSLKNYRDACKDAEKEDDWKEEAEETEITIELINSL